MAATTSRDLRTRNRARVLRALVTASETTRADLATACGLSPATITNVVADLIREGLVEERGLVPSEGGRPIARLGVRPDGAFLLGADVGEKGVAVELFDLALTRLDREFHDAPTRATDPAPIGEALRAAVAAIRARNPEREPRLVGLGLGLPGIVEDASGSHEGHGEVLHAQSLGWPALPVDELVRPDGLEVFAENGAKTLAMAERWFGAARDVEHAIVALLGRGVGLGVVSAGELLRGSAAAAGEWGHTKISVDGPRCRCGGTGCLEAYVGADALVAAWRERGGDPVGTGWRAITGLVAAADAGDPAAGEVLDRALDVLGVSLANLVNLLNPQKIVVGGWVGLCLVQARRDDLAERIRAASLTRPGSQFSLELCHFEGDAVALGAALLPLERLIDRPLTARSP
jgi:predicted NBD/HSP70 family sugar kinase